MCVPPDSGKDMKSLATLTCSVLRRALPKLPLPIPSKLNPIKYLLPNLTFSAQLTSDASTTCTCTLHTSQSAPHLTSLNTLRQDECHTALPGVAPNHNTYLLSLTDGATSHSTEEPGSGAQEQPSCHVVSDSPWRLAEPLAFYDKFFPELDGHEGITKTQSLPLLPTECVHEHMQCLLGDRGVESDTETDLVSQQLHSLSLVIPTAQLLAEASEETLVMKPIEGVSPPSVAVEEDLCTFASVESVCPFVEIPAPQCHGHTSRTDPEPLYKKTPSVERLVWEFIYSMCVHMYMSCSSTDSCLESYMYM